MPCPRLLARLALAVFVLSPLTAAAQTAAPAVTDARWLVPAYANPCCAGGPAMWSALIAAAQARPQQIAVIVNPASGPGASPIDPNYINAAGQGPLVPLAATNALLLGYISTSYGSRDLNTVRAEMTRYFDAAYWRNTSVRVDGFFFDEMDNNLADVGYYRQLRDHARSLAAGAVLVGNPGIYTYANPSGQVSYGANDYGAVFDALVLHEAGHLAVNHDYIAPSWLGSPGAARPGFIAYGATTGMQVRVAMSRMLQRNAGYLYVTDDGLPNPYDQLSSFWTQQLGWLDELVFADNFD